MPIWSLSQYIYWRFLIIVAIYILAISHEDVHVRHARRKRAANAPQTRRKRAANTPQTRRKRAANARHLPLSESFNKPSITWPLPTTSQIFDYRFCAQRSFHTYVRRLTKPSNSKIHYVRGLTDCDPKHCLSNLAFSLKSHIKNDFTSSFLIQNTLLCERCRDIVDLWIRRLCDAILWFIRDANSTRLLIKTCGKHASKMRHVCFKYACFKSIHNSEPGKDFDHLQRCVLTHFTHFSWLFLRDAVREGYAATFQCRHFAASMLQTCVANAPRMLQVCIKRASNVRQRYAKLASRMLQSRANHASSMLENLTEYTGNMLPHTKLNAQNP